jgi:hypothetical protein
MLGTLGRFCTQRVTSRMITLDAKGWILKERKGTQSPLRYVLIWHFENFVKTVQGNMVTPFPRVRPLLQVLWWLFVYIAFTLVTATPWVFLPCARALVACAHQPLEHSEPCRRRAPLRPRLLQSGRAVRPPLLPQAVLPGRTPDTFNEQVPGMGLHRAESSPLWKSHGE